MNKAIAYIVVDGEVGSHSQVAETLDKKKREIVAQAAELGLSLAAVYADIRREMEATKIGLRTMLTEVTQGKSKAIVVENFEAFADPYTLMMDAFSCMKDNCINVYILNENRILKSEEIELIWRALKMARQFDQKIVAARIKRGLKHATLSGRRIGRRPFEDYEINTEIFENVHNMRERGLSLRDICKALNSAGVKTNSQKKWYPTTVKRMLERSSPDAVNV